MRTVRTVDDPAWVRVLLIAAAACALTLLVVLPLAAVFAVAFGDGIEKGMRVLRFPEVRSAAWLTLLSAGISVPLNAAFGVAAAWLLARFTFPGRAALLTLLELPLSVSPVVAGLMLVLLFGRTGYLRPWLDAWDVKVLFAVPGIVLATTFVTFPYVAREVLPHLQAEGSAEEEAALTLGASAWTMFGRVTLPKIRWSLAHGLVLTNARAIGEFGAVSVVSGHIRGKTNTLPLTAEILFNEYNIVGAFSVAALLVGMALLMLAFKKMSEGRAGHRGR